MNRPCNYNTTTNISSDTSCMLSCEGKSHDVSNLLYTTNNVLPSSCPSLKLGIRRSSSSERISRGPLYPCAKDLNTEETAPSCLQEWISGGTTDSSQDDQWKVTSHYPQHHYQQQEKQPLPPMNYEKQQVTFSDPNPAAEEEQEQEEEGDHPLLQIAPGIRVPYIGTAERTRALIKYSVKEQRTTVQADCFSCQASLVCMAGMKYVACIACHTVSPLPEDATHHVQQQNGAGIGLLREEAEILRRRAHC